MIFPDVSWAAIAPEIALVAGAVAILLVDVQWKPEPRVLGGIVALSVVAAAVLSVGQWFRLDTPSDITIPFGGMIAFDRVSVLARFVLLAVTAMGVAGGWRLFERLGRRAAEALALVLLATVGFSFMASSIHLVMIFLGLEVGSISLYVLAGITRERPDSDEAAMKYFLLGSFASAVFIYGVALLFAGTGRLALLGQRAFLDANIVTRPAVLLIGMALVIVGLGFKVSAAPFHTWAPDVYQGAPAGVVGFMAAGAKIGGFAALTRILFTGFPLMADEWASVVAIISALSMGIGVVLALVQDDVRRMLAYSGVAHAGFILTGVVAGAAAEPGIWFYLAAYTIQLVAGFAIVAAVTGSAAGRSGLDAFAGLAVRSPFLAAAFTVTLLGMAGIPLTSGFVAKFGVFVSAWQAGFSWLVIVAVLASVVAFGVYLRVIVVMYMREPGEAASPTPSTAARWMLVAATVSTILFGVLPQPLLDLARNAFSV